jgi:hypothetical protein
MELDSTVHGLTELRVHGVSGTPPEQMLDQPAELIKRVAGASKAGFWRRWYPGGTSHDQPDERHLEAYAWGQLTSGPATRALWLLLLPFTLINVAHWMLPPYRKAARIGAVSVALLRLLGLTLTLMMLVATCTATMDLAAWQCAAVPRCAERLGPFSRLGTWTVGERLVAGAVLPGLLVLLLWWLGHVSRHDYAASLPDPAVRKGDCPLADERFWSSDRSTRRLRAAHVTAWCAGLGALTLLPVVRFGDAGTARSFVLVLLVLDAAVLAVAVLATGSNATTSRGGDSADRYSRPLARLRLVAVSLLVVSLAVTLVAPAHYPAGPSYLPGLRPAINSLLITQGLLLVGLAGCVAAVRPWRLGREPAGYRVALFGFAAPVMGLLAWLVGGALSVGTGVWVARYLGQAATSTGQAVVLWRHTQSVLADPNAPFQDRVAAAGAKLPLIVPPPFFWAGAAAVVVLAVTVFVAGVAALRTWLRAGALSRQVQEQHAAQPGDQATLKHVALMWSWARLTDRAGLVLGWMAAAATATMVAGAAMYLGRGFSLDPGSKLVWLTAPGVSLIAATAAGVVSLGFWAFRDEKIRRTVGILWDLATFWPRANHPLTPPCYGERAVPDLVDRVRQLSTAEADRVILSGHSQGSILVVAAVLHLGDGLPSRPALLTYGAPLRRLYARFFPAYFNAEAFAQAREWTGEHWINLWAESDPIGSWVCTEAGAGLDRGLTDPLSLARGADGSYPPVCGHSGFLGRPEYATAVEDLAAAPAETDA